MVLGGSTAPTAVYLTTAGGRGKGKSTTGDVIGCGVNFGERIAFYTKNGKVIGKAFTEIRGKLYPAVSFDISQDGLQISAVFPSQEGNSVDFVFKGPYDGNETRKQPELKLPEDKDHKSDNSVRTIR